MLRGRGRRPRRPVRPWASLMASPMSFRGRGAPRTSRPTMGGVVWNVVGADVPAARVPVGVPMASRGQRRAGDVAPYQVRAWRACADVACVCGARCACANMARCVVGADVPGGPRTRGRSRWRPRGQRRAGDVAPYQVRACQVRAWRACAARGVRVRTWRGAW